MIGYLHIRHEGSQGIGKNSTKTTEPRYKLLIYLSNQQIMSFCGTNIHLGHG